MVCRGCGKELLIGGKHECVSGVNMSGNTESVKVLDRLADIENVLRIGFRMLYAILKAIYCFQKGDAIAANSYAVNSDEEIGMLADE